MKRGERMIPHGREERSERGGGGGPVQCFWSDELKEQTTCRPSPRRLQRAEKTN